MAMRGIGRLLQLDPFRVDFGFSAAPAEFSDGRERRVDQQRWLCFLREGPREIDHALGFALGHPHFLRAAKLLVARHPRKRVAKSPGMQGRKT
jgi:hypothetical protein